MEAVLTRVGAGAGPGEGLGPGELKFDVLRSLGFTDVTFGLVTGYFVFPNETFCYIS